MPGIIDKAGVKRIPAGMSPVAFSHEAQCCSGISIGKGQALRMIGQALEQGK